MSRTDEIRKNLIVFDWYPGAIVGRHIVDGDAIRFAVLISDINYLLAENDRLTDALEVALGDSREQGMDSTVRYIQAALTPPVAEEKP